jgi:hypothetical protein
MLNKHTTDRNFNKFCKAMHKDSGISIIPFQVWKQKHLEELTEAYDIIMQDAKMIQVNSLKK